MLGGLVAAAIVGASPALAAAAAAPVGDAFAGCEHEVRAQPGIYEPYACFLSAARSSGRWEEAEARLARLGEELPFDGWTILLRGHLWFLRDEPRAIVFYRRAAAAFAAVGGARGEIIARQNLRSLLQRRGNVVAAAAEVERIQAVARRSGDAALRAQALVVEATHLLNNAGDLGLAHRNLQRAARMMPPTATYDQQMPALSALARVSYQLGRYDEAVESYERMLALALANGDAVEEATTLFNIANARQRQLEERPTPGSLALLEPLASVALDAARRAGNPLAEVRASALLAQLEAARGDRAAARSRLEEALAKARELGHPERQMICLWLLADLAADHDPAEARRRSAEAAAMALAGGNDRQLADAWQSRMRVDWATRPRDEAIATSWRALGAIESLAARQPGEEATVGLFGAWTRDYRWLAGRLLEGPTPNLDLAFAVMERMRARALLASLEEERTVPSGAPDAAAQRQGEALRALIEVQRQLLSPELLPAERDALVARLEERELDLAEARGAAHGGAPESSRRGPRVFADLAEIRRSLHPREALLLYQVAPWRDLYGRFAGGSWVLAVSPAGSAAYRLPDRSLLDPLVPVFLGLIARRDGSEVGPATRLWQELLEAPLSSLPKDTERLLVVPDGALFSVPFEVLTPPGGTARGEPFGVRYEVAIVPSATALLRWRTAAAPRPTRSALVLADPSLPGGKTVAATVREATLGEGVLLGRLPAARHEGRRLTRLLAPTSELLEGGAATERALARADLADFAILHLAAHAIADGLHPQRSAVLLAAADAAEDGLLQGREIARLPLRGRTVVLSACRTAAGAATEGEGPLSVARAFQQAGARAVVASRWTLRDEEAADIVTRLYRQLAAGRRLGEALQAARREAWAKGRPPADWAALVLMGEPDVDVLGGVPLAVGLPAATLPLAAVLVGVLLAIGWSWRRARARRA